MKLRALLNHSWTRASVGFVLIACGIQYINKLAEEKAEQVDALDRAIAQRRGEHDILGRLLEERRAEAVDVGVVEPEPAGDVGAPLVDLDALAAYAERERR